MGNMKIYSNKIDTKIIDFLGNKKMNATKISKKLVLGRTTIQYRLQKLVREKVLHREKGFKHEVLYSINRNILNISGNSRQLGAFSDKNIIRAYKYITELPKDNVIYSIQGKEAVRNIFKILPNDFIKSAHSTYRRKRFIIKGIINKNTINDINGMDKEMAKSHIGRTVGLRLIDGNILNGPCELISCKSVFLISNTEDRKTFIIKDKNIVTFLYEIFAMLYETSDNIRIFNLNDYFKQLATNRG